MSNNTDLIKKFYTAFAKQDAEGLSQCYHPDIKFNDPVFGNLSGSEVSGMWKMLIERSKGKIQIELSDVLADVDSGSAKWTATYNFSRTNRKIVNTINASFLFLDGLIIQHNDSFDFYKWCRQAFGWKGYLLGWTPFMQDKVRNQARLSLKNYRN